MQLNTKIVSLSRQLLTKMTATFYAAIDVHGVLQ